MVRAISEHSGITKGIIEVGLIGGVRLTIDFNGLNDGRMESLVPHFKKMFCSFECKIRATHNHFSQSKYS